MSSTGRGPRLGGPDDFYVTPTWCVRRMMEAAGPLSAPYLEPAAGDGAIIKAIGAEPGYPWHAVECRATAKAALFAAGAETVHVADFLTWEPPPDLVISTIITNPPYALAEEFIRRAAELFPDAVSIWLVRLGFLASEKRTRLWRDLGAPDVYVLPNRPSFTPDGHTDSADYAWIVLPDEYRTAGRFEVLASTPAAERGRRAPQADPEPPARNSSAPTGVGDHVESVGEPDRPKTVSTAAGSAKSKRVTVLDADGEPITP